MKFVLTIISVVAIFVPATFATIHTVTVGSDGIQAAIDGAANGDTVLVLSGIYFENISFNGKSVVVTSQFLFDPDPRLIEETVIDGSLPGSGDSGSVVSFAKGEDSNSVLHGLTLANGLGTAVPGTFAGGGILITSGSSPRIEHNIIRNNNALIGGGIYVRAGNPTITRNAIYANSAGKGGGITLIDAESRLSHNVFYANTAADTAGSVFCSGSVVQFDHNVVAQGAALAGGGLFVKDDCNWTVSHCNFFENNNGDVMGLMLAGFGDVSWGVNFNKQPVDRYLNLFCDPLLVDAEGLDFTPACTSHLIDAGAGLPETFPRGGKRKDIGMFEYAFTPGDLNDDGKFNLGDATLIVNIFFRDAALPCPRWVTDLDCNRRINISDLVAFLAYWRGYATPCCLDPNCP